MKLMENPKLIERPGYLGRKKLERHKEWDEKFGAENWNFVWRFGDNFTDFLGACQIYEDAYFQDSFKREGLWELIFKNAKNVFDNTETNINSETDYEIQEAYSTHLQDIAVRRVGIRRGWKFEGNKLIQIRGPKSEGYALMPGIVPFHLPNLIGQPNIAPSWADSKSVEAFYQNNRWLSVISNSAHQ